MLRRGGIGVLHDGSTELGFDVDGVNLIALQCPVEVERSPGTRRRDYGNPRPAIVGARGGVSGKPRLISIRTEAGQSDDIAAASHRDPGHCRGSAGASTRAARAGIGRNSTMRHRVRPAATAFFSSSWTFAGKSAPRPVAAANTGAAS